MKERLHELKWYVKVAIHFGKLSLQSTMEYPLNFASGVCVELAYMMIKLVYLYVVLSTGMKVGSLTPDMVIIFVGTYIFMTGVWMLLSGVNSIPEQVVRGDLDLLMTKPGSLQFLQTFGKYNFALAFPNAAVGIFLMAGGWKRCAIPGSWHCPDLFLWTYGGASGVLGDILKRGKYTLCGPLGLQ